MRLRCDRLLQPLPLPPLRILMPLRPLAAIVLKSVAPAPPTVVELAASTCTPSTPLPSERLPANAGDTPIELPRMLLLVVALPLTTMPLRALALMILPLVVALPPIFLPAVVTLML